MLILNSYTVPGSFYCVKPHKLTQVSPHPDGGAIVFVGLYEGCVWHVVETPDEIRAMLTPVAPAAKPAHAAPQDAEQAAELCCRLADALDANCTIGHLINIIDNVFTGEFFYRSTTADTSSALRNLADRLRQPAP